ncbi:MAG: DUF6340 family protein [Mangrovibacterium sp.]
MTILYTRKFSTGLLILMLLLASCSQPYRLLTIETSRPSTHLLPTDIQSLTLVNRGITGEFQNFNKDSLQQYFYDKGFKVNSVVLDSLAADTTLKALGELLFESGRYDVVIPEERNLNREQKFYQVPESLDWDEVASICQDFNTDALMVIERYFNKIMTDYHVYISPEGKPQFVSASIDSKYNMVIKVYDPSKKSIVRQIVVDDTISWSNDDYTTEGLFRTLPSIKEALIQTGIQTALDADNQISPAWVKENRLFFVLAEGDESRIRTWANNNEWQNADDYWQKFAGSQKPSEKSKAEFNLALAAEMLGDIDSAIEWANKSLKTRYMNQTNNYLLRLKQRQELLKKFER